MDKPYFVMVYSQNSSAVFPLTDEKDEVALYGTEQEARSIADNHFAAKHFGYEIFEMGTGE